MVKPVRVQRSRKKGSQQASPNGLPIRYCGRPGPLGNPFRVSNGDCTHPDCGPRSHPAITAAEAVECFRDWFLHHPDLEKFKAELRGKNLSCWCPLDQPCHVDVILEIVNA